MFERLNDLHGRVQETRQRLGTLAEQAAELNSRLRADSGLVGALEKLTQSVPRGTRVAAATLPYDNEDGHFVSEAWEIALINEEGK